MKATMIFFAMIIAAPLIVFSPAVTCAAPSAQLSYVETALGGGIWQYNYTFVNTSDPVTDSGFNLYDVLLYLDESETATVLSYPAGWEYISGPGILDVLSMNEGVPPTGTDIAPGTSLGEFVFQLNYQAGPLAFDATFADPGSPGNFVAYQGTTAPAEEVPEPAIVILLCSGLAGIMAFRRRFGL